jgi:hypothetical protein
MVTNLARFGEVSGKNLCNFSATQRSCIAFLHWDASKTQAVFIKKKNCHECDTKWSAFSAYVLQSKMADLSPDF